MNILLIEDIPEKGKHWKKGKVVYNVDPDYFYQYFKDGVVIEYEGKEPVWGRKEDRLRDEEEE